MALQLGALRDALVDAGAQPEMARAAAEEVAGYENRLTSIDGQLAALRASVDTQGVRLQTAIDAQGVRLQGSIDGEVAKLRASMDLRFERVEGKMTLLQWQLGVLIAGVASLVLKAFL